MHNNVPERNRLQIIYLLMETLKMELLKLVVTEYLGLSPVGKSRIVIEN